MAQKDSDESWIDNKRFHTTFILNNHNLIEELTVFDADKRVLMNMKNVQSKIEYIRECWLNILGVKEEGAA